MKWKNGKIYIWRTIIIYEMLYMKLYKHKKKKEKERNRKRRKINESWIKCVYDIRSRNKLFLDFKTTNFLKKANFENI